MWTFIRYILIAGIIYVIDLGGYYLLLQAGVGHLLANVIVKVVAVLTGFYLHRRFTYQITERQDAVAHAKKYFGLAFVYTPVSSVTLFLVMLVLPKPVIAKIISDVLLFIGTYWVTTQFTFKTSRSADRKV